MLLLVPSFEKTPQARGDQICALQPPTAVRTLPATPPAFLAGAFLVTPPVVFLGAAAGAVVVADLRPAPMGLERLMVGWVSTVWKTRGLALPVWERVPSRTMLAVFYSERKK